MATNDVTTSRPPTPFNYSLKMAKLKRKFTKDRTSYGGIDTTTLSLLLARGANVNHSNHVSSGLVVSKRVDAELSIAIDLTDVRAYGRLGRPHYCWLSVTVSSSRWRFW